MHKKITSVKGLFGQIIHYRDGTRVGESWPGLFEGSLNHYDANGKYIGYSDRGFIAEQVHHDACGRILGETHTGFFGEKKHYGADGRYVAESWEAFGGEVSEWKEEGVWEEASEFDDCFDGEDG